jgi:histone H3/H4
MKSAHEGDESTELNISFTVYKFKKTSNDLSKRSLLRVFRKSGCKRVSRNCFKIAQESARHFMQRVIKKSIDISKCGNRKTISLSDVMYALKLNNFNHLI